MKIMYILIQWVRDYTYNYTYLYIYIYIITYNYTYLNIYNIGKFENNYKSEKSTVRKGKVILMKESTILILALEDTFTFKIPGFYHFEISYPVSTQNTS